MRGPARPGDNHGKASLMRGFGKGRQTGWGAVCRNNLYLLGGTKIIKHACGILHRPPVRLTAHANGYFVGECLRIAGHDNLF